MSLLFAMSFDCQLEPFFDLKFPKKNKKFGWGVAWYPNEDFTASVMKDTDTKFETAISKSLTDLQKFSSSIFMCFVKGASKKPSIQDTQPFSRSFAARDWVFSHLGQLEPGFIKGLGFEKHPVFEPMGKTDTEYILCWLLREIHKKKARKFSDFGWENLHGLFKKLNKLGTTNFIMSDGKDLIAYQDENNFKPLYWVRKTPPHEQTHFEIDNIIIDIEDNLSVNQTFTIISSTMPDEKNSQQMSPGQMLVIRRGKILWDSVQDSNDSNLDVVEDVEVDNKFRLNVDIPKIKKEKDKSVVILKVIHNTKYTYKKPVELSKHHFRLYPVQDTYQQVLDYNLLISTKVKKEVYEDVFGNRNIYLEITKPYDEIFINMETIVSIYPYKKLKMFALLRDRRRVPVLWMPWERQMMMPYLLSFELPEFQLVELTDFAMSFVERNDYDLIETLEDINHTIFTDFEYKSGSTNLQTTPYEVYTTRKGVCQDFANLFICLARILSVPARYRVGYIYTGTDYENKEQADASHAWVEIYIPWLGWVGFDPTNGCLADKNHIRIACGRNYYDATPTSGTIYKGGGFETLTTGVQVIDITDEYEGDVDGK